jgi:hypothetical protein
MSGGEYRPQDLLAQTARVGWQELERHFARGVVIRVDSDLDLVQVATSLANDDKVVTEAWLAAGRIASLDTATARRWACGDAELWAVVIAPWVMVQERRFGSESVRAVQPG